MTSHGRPTQRILAPCRSLYKEPNIPERLENVGLIRQSRIPADGIQTLLRTPLRLRSVPDLEEPGHCSRQRQQQTEGKERRCGSFLRGPAELACDQKTDTTTNCSLSNGQKTRLKGVAGSGLRHGRGLAIRERFPEGNCKWEDLLALTWV